MSTRGDELLDERLDQVGGKGLFVKELESAMADGRADLAVHSMKDVPAELPPGFVARRDHRARGPARCIRLDAATRRLTEMPKGLRVGTSSLRRAAQIAERYPELEIRLLRGNVETRLAKLDRGEYDAIVLAAAGLMRLGLAQRITSRLELDESLPAPGQGALGIECLAGADRCRRADCAAVERRTSGALRARRAAVSRALGGNCTLPLAAYAESRREAACGCARWWPRADGRRVLRAPRPRAPTRTPWAPRWRRSCAAAARTRS